MEPKTLLRAILVNRAVEGEETSFRLVLVALAHREALREDAEQGIHEPGLEVFALFALDLLGRLLEGPGRLVGADREQRVEHVCDGDDAGGLGDGVALEPAGVTGAIPAFVVAERDAAGGD